MLSKAVIDDVKYLFKLYTKIRADCPLCHQRMDTVSFRIIRPEKRRIRVCYECLLRFALSHEKQAQQARETRERIDEFQAKEKEREEKPVTIDPVVHITKPTVEITGNISGKETWTKNSSTTSAGSDSNAVIPD